MKTNPCVLRGELVAIQKEPWPKSRRLYLEQHAGITRLEELLHTFLPFREDGLTPFGEERSTVGIVEITINVVDDPDYWKR